MNANDREHLGVGAHGSALAAGAPAEAREWRSDMTLGTRNLFDAAAACLAEPDPERKRVLTAATAAAWRSGLLVADAGGAGPILESPGRPAKLELVAPRQLPRRRLTSLDGRVALIHAVAHIEHNAINLAWDAIQRFRDLSRDFYADWIQVAAEEAEHFGLMGERLADLGRDYGDLPAHDGLWEMARRTAHDPLARMALVPRVLEARGLDVTPGMIERLEAAGDPETAARLRIILRDEVRHVAAGSRWFRRFCASRRLEARATFFALLDTYLTGEVRGPLNLPDRRRAGFDEEELLVLKRRGADRGDIGPSSLGRSAGKGPTAPLVRALAPCPRKAHEKRFPQVQPSETGVPPGAARGRRRGPGRR